MNEPTVHATAPANRRLRFFAFALTFATFGFATPLFLFDALDDLGVEKVEVGLDVIDVVHAALPKLEEDPTGRTWNVAFFGDSMVVSYPPGRTVPERLEQAARETPGPRPDIAVLSVAAPGMGPFDYYLIADLVADAKPDQVILPFNLAALSDPWRGTFSRPELAGWIEPQRVPAALLLRLEWIGLTTDRMLLYVTIVGSRADALWHALTREQARLGRARTLVATALETHFASTALHAFGIARFRDSDARNMIRVGKQKRLTPFGLRERYGPALDGIDADHPVVEVLEAAVERFHRDGIRVLVYASPANIANIEEGGVFDEKGMLRTLEVIAGAVRGAGGTFADFSRLLPDAGFRDAAGHFNTRSQGVDGPKLLAEALGPLVVEEARTFAERAANGAR